MKYKVGDKVRIKSLDWYNENKDKRGFICFDYANFIPEMSRYCGEILTINQVVEEYEHYHVSECAFSWTDEMIEGLVEEETKPEPKFKVGDSVEVLKSGNVYTISQMKFNGKEFVYTLSNNGSTVSCFSEEEIEFTEEDKYWCDIMSESDPTTYVLPQGYQFVDENGNIINATKIVLEKKKKEYPKTYEECCKVLDVCSGETLQYGDLTLLNDYEFNLYMLLENFRKLRICRDAYWKIAGDEMGLDKPWAPDWCDYTTKYCIIYSPQYRGICKRQYDGIKHILAFPTEEMRDAFYENFNELIESVKELL